MSRSFTGSTSNYLETTNDESFYSIDDRTVLVYVKVSSLPSANSTIFWGGTDSASDVYGTISLNSSNVIRGTARNGATDEVVTTETLATGTWVPIVCRYTLDTDEFLVSGSDWSKRATGTTDEAFAASGDSRMALGCNRDTTPSDPFTGLIAHLAVWDAKLSDSDIESLVGGADPTTIAVADRFAYWPLTDSSLTDTWSGSAYELSIGGTVSTDADNPTFGSAATAPAISSINTSTLVNGRTAVNLTGTDFGTATGVVTISSENSVSGSVTTTITPSGWADTSASFTASRGSIQLLTDAFMFVTSDAGDTNTDGATVSFTPIVTIEDSFRDISATALASLSNLSVLIWHDVPTGAPDEVLSAQALDGAGTASWEISAGSLAVDDPVWYSIFDSAGGSVATSYKTTPTYS